MHPRERYILHRATGFPYISPISSGLRWRGERDIPKNVFFLREEVLIYDAPESATFPRMFFPPQGGFNLRCTRERDIPKNVFFLREEVLIYDAPSLPRKDNRFDQELPSIRGSKVWR